MRVIVGPHAVVSAPPREQPPAHVIVEERRIDLPLEVFARQFIDGQFFGVSMTLKGFVALSEPERHPADLVFHRDDVQCWIPLKDSRKDHFEQSVFYLSGLAHTVTISGNSLCRPAMHAGTEAGQDVQMNRHVEILGSSPEALIMLRREGQLRMRNLPNHRTHHPLFLAALRLGDRVIDIVH